MPIQIRYSLRLLLLITIAIAVVFITLANRQERASSLSRQQTDREGKQVVIDRFLRNKVALPDVDYTAAESRVEAQSKLRKVRAKRYNGRWTPFAKQREDTVEITAIEESLVSLPALPVAESDAVVVGTIKDARGYLSEDKSGAFSEYAVEVTEALKAPANLTGSQIIADRIGARVILPKGRTILYWDPQKGTPEVGHRYVLFLNYHPEGDDYSILTGYELINGHATPLDRDQTFAIFDSNEETAFLDLVRSRVK